MNMTTASAKAPTKSVPKPKPKSSTALSAEQQEENIRKQNENLLWTRVLSMGSVIIARVNRISTRAKMLAVVAALAVVFDVVRFSGIGSAPSTDGYRPNTAVLNTWVEGMRLTQVSAQFAQATPTSAQWAQTIERYKANPQALRQECTPTDDLAQSWLNPKSGFPDAPRCKISSHSNTVWVATFVQHNINGTDTLFPVLGVMHEAGGWQYHNVDAGLGNGLWRFSQYPTVTLADISVQAHQDFPGLMQLGDVSAPTSAIGKAQQWINKLRGK
jgi:hypothetical protein